MWPPCSFSNKEPSKTTVCLPCSGHVQEQKRLPPWLANDSTCGLQGSRLPWGFMLRACLCGVRARVHAGSCSEANMTLSDCLCHACLCLCCMRAHVCAGSCSIHAGPRKTSKGGWPEQPQPSRGQAAATFRGAAGKAGRSANDDSANGLMALPIRGKTATWVPLQLSFLI